MCAFSLKVALSLALTHIFTCTVSPQGNFFPSLFLLQPNRWMLIGLLWLDTDAEAGCSCNRLLCLVGTVIRAFDAKSHPRTPTRPKGYTEWHRTAEKKQNKKEPRTEKYVKKTAATRKNRKFSNSFDLVTKWRRKQLQGEKKYEWEREAGGDKREREAGLELHV